MDLLQENKKKNNKTPAQKIVLTLIIISIVLCIIIGIMMVYLSLKGESKPYSVAINGKNIEYDLGNVKVIVTAYAIQAATFDSVADAYNAYNSQMSGIPENAVDID